MSADTNKSIPIEHCLVRYEEIEARKAHFRPRDMVLPRFERERFTILGRPGESNNPALAALANEHFTMVCIRAEPGKGFASHSHDTAEAFVVMAGQWECVIGDESVIVGPFDTVVVPEGVFQSLTNIGDVTGVTMAINAGGAGAPIRLDPKVLKELASAGVDVSSDVEFPPGAKN